MPASMCEDGVGESNLTSRNRGRHSTPLQTINRIRYNQEGDKDTRRVPAGGKLRVGVTLLGLEPGEYNAVLRFAGMNSTTDDSQKLPLTIYVRSHIGWALLWLIGSVIVSFIATKVLVAQRRRINLQRQIHDMMPPWFFGL